MRRPATRAATLAACLAFAACDQVLAPKAAYRPEQAGTVDRALCLLGFTAVPLREAVTGHHLVDVTVNGVAATFVLDTGANASVIHAPYADRFGLTVLPSLGGAIGLGGAMSVGQARIKELKLGSVTVRQSRLATADLSQLVNVLGRLTDRPISGIIGQDVMKQHHAVIDVSAPILHLIADPTRRDPAPNPACAAPQETS